MTIFLFLVFSTVSFHASAQDKWSLEKCIDHAHENNIQVKQQSLNIEYGENNLKQSKFNLLPNLNASANNSYSFGRALDETTYEFTEDERVISANASINSSITLFNGLQNYNSIKRNEFELKAAIQNVEKLKNDISLNIASAYLQILFNMELLDVAKKQLEITQLQVERTSKLVDAGSLARGALLEIEAQAAAEDLQVVTAQNQLDLSYLTLTQILDLDSVGGFEIKIPELESVTAVPISVTVLSVYQDAQKILPQIKSARYQLSSAEKSLDLAMAGRSPRLTLSAYYGSGYSDIRQKLIGIDPETYQPIYEDYPFWEQMNDNASTTVSLGLSIPIFNRWQVNTNISNARLNFMNQRFELENKKNILYKNIQQAYSDATAAQKKYFSAQEALESMQESFKYTEQKFEVGLVNAVDYNTAKNQLARTESDLLQAKYDYIFRMKILDFYRGIPIRLE